MLNHILKQIWKNRRANGWIFAELVLVTAILWQIADSVYVDTRMYHLPLGYDIENVWFFQLESLNENAPNYVSDANGGSDLIRLREQIIQHPMVENICFAFYSSPYSFGNSFTSLYPIEGDTLAAQNQVFQVRQVSLDYFEVFRVKDSRGGLISPEQLAAAEKPLVISQDMEQLFFPNQEGKGKKVSENKTEALPIIAVCNPIRENDYEKSKPCFFRCLKEQQVIDFAQYFGSTSVEFSVRMKKRFTQAELNTLLMEMGDRLTANNLYVYSAKEIKEQRKTILSETQDNTKKQNAVITFVLINVFFGIIGTFWLRTQARKGEIGLRSALGSSKRGIRYYLYAEGLCLLILTIPFTLIYIINSLYFDVPDTYRLPYNATRFFLTFGATYLLIGCMIILGIRLPARKASAMQPAEALHYE